MSKQEIQKIDNTIKQITREIRALKVQASIRKVELYAKEDYLRSLDKTIKETEKYYQKHVEERAASEYFLLADDLFLIINKLKKKENDVIENDDKGQVASRTKVYFLYDKLTREDIQIALRDFKADKVTEEQKAKLAEFAHDLLALEENLFNYITCIKPSLWKRFINRSKMMYRTLFKVRVKLDNNYKLYKKLKKINTYPANMKFCLEQSLFIVYGDEFNIRSQIDVLLLKLSKLRLSIHKEDKIVADYLEDKRILEDNLRLPPHHQSPIQRSHVDFNPIRRAQSEELTLNLNEKITETRDKKSRRYDK